MFHGQLPTSRIERGLSCKESWHYAGTLLTLPYLACHAKKYNKAAKGWPTSQKLTQKTEFPMILPVGPFHFSRGTVAAIRGNWNIMPANATPAIQMSA